MMFALRKYVSCTWAMGLLACQAPSSPSRPPLAAQRQADVTYLVQQLAARHPALYAHLTPAAWQLAVQELRAQAPTYSAEQWRWGVQRLVARLGDGHTRVARPTTLRTYPVAFRWFADSVYVTLTHGPLARPASGLRLVRVNGQPIETVLQQLSSLVSADNAVGRMTVFDDEPTVKAALVSAFPNTPPRRFPGPLYAATERVAGDL